MNHRQRALAAMLGEPVDHIPFIARMDLWYSYHRNTGTLPHPYEKATLWEMQRDMGVGIFGFGAWDVPFYRLQYEGVDINVAEEQGDTVTRYGTPYGVLTMRESMSDDLKEAAGAGARVEFPFKSSADYDALQFLLDHGRVVENVEEYGRFVDGIGDDGVALAFAGWLPAHQLMLHYMGYERFYYELADNAARVERLIDTLTERQQRVLELAAQCPATAIEVGANYDESMTPPPIFERFFSPFYRQTRRFLNRHGKILVVHGDGEMKRLLHCLRDCEAQVVEALTPQPMTSINVAETRRLWQGRVAMWGGLPTITLTSTFSDDEFERSLDELLRAVAPGDRFILGYGDNVPTDGLFHRIQRVAQFWAEKGTYPLPGAGA